MERHVPPLFVIALAVSLPMISCEQDTKVRIDGKNPPTIKLSGSGGIYFLRVMEEPTEPNFYEKGEGGIWQIDPEEGPMHKHISEYSSIKYGELPPGFIQRIPKDGSPPPSLQEGRTYHVWTPTWGANGGGVKFTIQEGKSIEVP